MSDAVLTKCIAPNCDRHAVLGSALCRSHTRQLQQAEDAILTDATRKIRAQVRQFERLSLIEPPLHSAEIAFRMAEPMKVVRGLLKKFKDDRA